MVQDRGQLVAKGFAEGGGGLHEDIVSFEHGGDDFFLAWPSGLLFASFQRWIWVDALKVREKQDFGCI